jgi:DNA-binding NarL/FixJ family response regulator
MQKKLQVGLVDGEPITFAGLQAKFTERKDMEICFYLADVKNLTVEAATKKPAIIISELILPAVDGMDGSFDGTQIPSMLADCSPNTRVIHFSGCTDNQRIARAQHLGSWGFVSKTKELNVLIAAVLGVECKQKNLWPLKRLNELQNTIPLDNGNHLTRRETHVLRLISIGLNNKDISRSLGIGVETVKEHVQNILHKLHVKDRTQAAIWGVQKNLTVSAA